MSNANTTRHFQNLTRLFAALLPACGQSVDETQFSENLCMNGQVRALATTTPSEPVDAIELREATLLSAPGQPEEVSDMVTLDQVGVPCATAAEMATCLAARTSVPYTSQLVVSTSEGPRHRSLVYTRGDTVGSLHTLPELLAYLGNVESPGDAALVAYLSDYSIRCDAARNVGPHPDGHVVYTRRGSGCGEGDDVYDQVVLVGPDGSTQLLEEVLVEEGDPGCSIGRFPAGLCRQERAHARTLVGSFLAQVAELEAASVHAFMQLARELAAHGAPRSLVRAAITAAGDEVRHARTMTRHARRFGGLPRQPVVTATPVRSLVDIALDNAVEGCVRETFGAASAHLSARTAGDRGLRRAFATIATEETQHAALSWSLHEYLATRLSPAQRTRVNRHRRDAGVHMERELTAPLDESVHVATGIPRPREARRLYRGVITQRHQST